MITLKIFNQDGSPYWTEYFNEVASCNQWLAEEKTRPYYPKGATEEIIDNTPPPPTQAEKDKEIAKKERKQALIDKHAAMKPSDLDTIVELRQAIMELQELIGIRG